MNIVMYIIVYNTMSILLAGCTGRKQTDSPVEFLLG